MIPAEAAVAAARRLYQTDGLNLWDKEDESTRAHYLRKATSALEAAAPYMGLSSVWHQAVSEAYVEGALGADQAAVMWIKNPYKTNTKEG